MTFSQFLSVVEMRTKVVSVSTYLLATLYAWTVGAVIDPVVALVLFAAVLCVDMGTTAFNSFYDFMRGVDNPLFTVEPDKVLVYAGVAPGHALLTSVGLYAGAALLGVAVAFATGIWVIGAGAVCMAIGFLYNGGPLPISRTPFGELFAGGFLGSVLFLVIVRVHVGQVNLMALLASLPSSLVIASILTVNNTCDREGDRAAGRRTLSVLLGTGGGEAVLYVLGSLAFLLPLAAGAAGLFLISPVGLITLALGFVVVIGIYASMHRRGFSHATKGPSMRSIIRVLVLFTAAASVALIA